MLSPEGSPADFGLIYQNVTFPSRLKSVELSGWYIPASDPCIVMVSGGYQNRNDQGIDTLQLARDLTGKGYSLVLFDMAGRGESEGKGRTLTGEELDISGAVDFAKELGHSPVYILAFSSGAVSSLLVEDVSAMVLDSCFANVKETFIRSGVEMGYPKGLVKMISPGAFLAARILYGYKPWNPEDCIDDVVCSIMFIHGGADTGIPYQDSEKLYNARGNHADQLWIVPGAGHCLSYKTAPEEYVDLVAAFLGKRTASFSSK